MISANYLLIPVLFGAVLFAAACASEPTSVPIVPISTETTASDSEVPVNTVAATMSPSQDADVNIATPMATTTSIDDDELVDCVRTPSQTEGPFYADIGGFRQDVTEGLTGVPLSVRFQVVEAGSCEPLSGVVVDIWHTDALGRYSAFERGGGDASDTFLRGKQITDADGVVEFHTIYPGWYRGRTTHIHFKASTDGGSLVTSQLYFPDETTAAVAEEQPYATRGAPDTTNEQDSILRGAGTDHPLMGTVSDNGDGYVVSFVIGVDAR